MTPTPLRPSIYMKGLFTWRLLPPVSSEFYHHLYITWSKCKISTHIDKKWMQHYPNLSFPLNNNNNNNQNIIILVIEHHAWFSSFMFKLHDVGNIELTWPSRCNDKHEGTCKWSLQSHTLYFMLLNVCRVSTILHEVQPFMWYYCLNVIMKGLVDLDYNQVLALR
jgi:hypothetical protein